MENQENYAVKTGDWVGTLLVTMIPIIGLIMLFVWAFDSSSNPSKANWAKAQLIWSAIFIGILILISVVFGATVFTLLHENLQ